MNDFLLAHLKLLFYSIYRGLYMSEKDRKIIEAIRRIVDKGGNAEVKRRKDGTLVVYEVKKNIVAS